MPKLKRIALKEGVGGGTRPSSSTEGEAFRERWFADFRRRWRRDLRAPRAAFRVRMEHLA